MIKGFEHFHDILDISLILAPVFDFFGAKCVQFPSSFTE